MPDEWKPGKEKVSFGSQFEGAWWQGVRGSWSRGPHSQEAEGRVMVLSSLSAF